MQKKLLAVAVAGVLAAPGVALAQSSVTISGVFKVSLENVSIGSANPSSGAPNASLTNVRPNGARTSESRLADDSSRIVFNVREDLGGGLAAIGQIDIRFKFDDNGAASVANVGGQIASGNTHVGLSSSTWGTVIFGRQDLHYFNTESDMTTKAISLRQDPISLLAYGGGGGVAIATASRTQNVTRWLSPNWSGFTMIAAYSTNGAGNDNDINSPIRRGSAWNLNPNYEASFWKVGYSYFQQKSDAVAGSTATLATTPAAGAGTVPLGLNAAAINLVGSGAFTVNPGSGFASALYAATEQRADRVYGSFKWNGFKFGLAWDRSKIKNNANDARGTWESSNRDAWSIPISWSGGNHNVYFHYTQAKDDKSTSTPGVVSGLTQTTVKGTTVAGVCGTAALGVCDTGAKMWAIGYVYDLSKRTSIGVSYSKITNDNGAVYNQFTTTSLGGQSAAILPGEDPKVFAGTIRHAF